MSQLAFDPLTNTHPAFRRFIITFYFVDGALQVYEPAVRNSGIQGGVIVQRRPQKSPLGEQYTSDDCYVGARLLLYSRCYELYEADEVTLTMMEAHPEVFPRADFLRVSAEP